MKKRQTTALYIHIPFCLRKCKYCAFASSEVRDTEEINSVIRAIIAEARHRFAEAPWYENTVDTVFFGGGTPSILRGQQLRQILDGIREVATISTDAEITIEVNPGTISDEKLDGWQAGGVNRISLGVQSLHEPTLRKLGRVHSAAQAEKAWQKCRDAGFDNMSLDLMFGIAAPDAINGAQETIKEVLEWEPEHLSSYALIVEPGTEFDRMEARGEAVKLGEDEEAEQYVALMHRMKAAGYVHYEVSNWAKPGRECRHNISYWDGGSYLAIGPAGHSYDAAKLKRFWNHSNTTDWLRSVEATGVGEYDSEILSLEQVFEERLSLSLRMLQGVKEELLAEWAGAAGKTWPPEPLSMLIENGFLEREKSVLRYTEKGLLIADELESYLTR